MVWLGTINSLGLKSKEIYSEDAKTKNVCIVRVTILTTDSKYTHGIFKEKK